MPPARKKTLLEIARDYAIDCHESTNHQYGGHPYEVHLQMVVDVAEQFLHLIPKERQEIVLASCWLHDSIEDTRQTYNDVSVLCGHEVADIVYALTNEKGRNRKERANEKYYQGISLTEYATFVKLCDRIANVKHSVNTNSRMLQKYRDEYFDFQKNLFFTGQEYLYLWDELHTILFEGIK